jgi:aryl-alcohol dehydrogenase-like predicted oxidoreductase
MKFGIGTAQFIENYGILKTNINKREFRKIINKFNKKIDLIDTASSYGESEKFIGNNCNKKYKIITKLDKIKSKRPDIIINEINYKLKNSLKNLKSKNVYCLLIHSEADIKLFNNKKIKNHINILKKKKIIKKIGISIYDISKLNNYLKVYDFDIVQIPLNIFSINNKIIEKLRKLKKKYKFEIHVRSIFFQGIIFKNLKNLPNVIKHLKKNIEVLHKNSKIYNTTVYNFAISSIDNLKIAEYAIIGISNNKDFIKLKKYKKIKIKKIDIEKISANNLLIDLRKLK